MRLVLAWMVCAALAILQGCSGAKVEGQARAEASSRIEVLALIFDDTVSMVGSDPKKAVNPSLLRSNAEIQQTLLTGVRERFPAVFGANGVQLQVYSRSNGEERFREEAKGRRHVLHMTPSAAHYSPGIKTTFVGVQATLEELSPRRTLWTGNVQVSRHLHASIDDKLIDELATKLVDELKRAGLIGPGARTVAAPATQTLNPGAEDVQWRRRSVSDVAAVPLLNERGREGYREWLTKSPPRAFVIADNGSWNSTWGTNPKDPSDPKDPVARALAACQKRGLPNCRLYAVDNNVVWSSQK